MTDVARSARGGAPSAGAGYLPVAVLLGLVSSLAALSISAVSVALPALGRDLAVGTGATAWVVSAYALTLGLGTALFGRLIDARGLRPCAAASVLLFAGGAVLAAVGSSLPAVAGGRLVQGLGGGGVVVVALNLLAARYPGADRTRAIAAMVAVITVISGCGTLIGGTLASTLGWRAVLALPVLALLALPVVLWLAPSTRPTTGQVDLVGAALTAATVGAVLFVLQAPAVSLPAALVAASGLLAVAAAGALLAWMRHRPEGFLPRSVLSNRRFVLGSATAFSLQAGYFVMLVAAPVLLEEDQRGPLQVGLILLPAAAVGAAVDVLVGRLVPRTGPYRIAAALAAGSATALLVGAATDTPALIVVSFSLAISGFAGGQSVLNDAVMSLVADRERGVAVGVFNLLLNLGGSVGAAALGGLAGVVGLSTSLLILAAIPAAGVAAALLASRPHY